MEVINVGSTCFWKLCYCNLPPAPQDFLVWIDKIKEMKDYTSTISHDLYIQFIYFNLIFPLAKHAMKNVPSNSKNALILKLASANVMACLH